MQRTQQLLFCAALGTLIVSSFACRSTPTSTSGVKDTVADKPEFSGLDLQMSGDEATGEITAKFQFTTGEFKAGDTVELRWDVVRSLEEPKVNCSALRGKDTVTLAGDGRSGSFTKKVDTKLFKVPFEVDPQEQAKANMDKLVNTGGTLRVEGCLMKPGASGNALGTGRGKMRGGKGKGLGLAGESDPPIVQFGRLCAEKLGALPAFSCLDETQFKIIPITQTDESGNVTTPNTRVDSCDRPIYLPTGSGGYCKPWARVGRIKVSDDVFAGVVCRRYWTPNYPAVTGPDDPVFNDVAVIQHNKKTGDTCYFQALGTLYAKRVPPPNELELPAEVAAEHPQAAAAKDFWLEPANVAGINCITCHDADAWMHSPYIDQPKTEDGDTWLPSAPRSKYNVLGAKFGFGNWPTTYSVKPKENGECASCHRVGSLKGCEAWAADSGGMKIPNQFVNAKTAYGKAFPQSHWMPTSDYGDIPTLADWTEQMGPAHKAMVDCCNVKRPDGSKILGLTGEFGSAKSRYGKTMKQTDIDILDAAGCKVTALSTTSD